ncbi:polysaccharide deacetylase Est4C [Firmicutes bacterium CAG:95]|nr:polysaccharide deacetylase Est4C [Firmicutes bacterium CAG:95]
MKKEINRSQRVKRLKKMILWTIALAILIPVTGCILLSVRVFQLKKQVAVLTEQLPVEEIQEEASGVYETTKVEESVKDTETKAEEPAKINPVKSSGKKVYLTFDDGPSSNTDQILDILKDYDVKATFFVVGKTDERSVKAYQRIVEEGHTLAMHSYSHRYDEIYESKEAFARDLNSLQEYLYETTGVWPRIYRFPGGSSNTVSKVDMQELIEYLTDIGITYFDWNVASGDAVSRTLPAETIVNNCLSGIEKQKESVILMHDASNKGTTIEALPQIIEAIQEQGDAELLPITDETVPVQHIAAPEKQ